MSGFLLEFSDWLIPNIGKYRDFLIRKMPNPALNGYDHVYVPSIHLGHNILMEYSWNAPGLSPLGGSISSPIMFIPYVECPLRANSLPPPVNTSIVPDIPNQLKCEFLIETQDLGRTWIDT